MGWDAAFDREATSLASVVCDEARVGAARLAAWRSLLARVAPHVEARARRDRVLRRCGLRTDDDVRAILVSVLERLRAAGYANLREFLVRRGASHGLPPSDARLDELARLARMADEDPDPPEAAGGGGDAEAPTPLRAWIFRLVDFVTRDHVRARLGWSSTERVVFALADARGVQVASLERLRATAGVVAAEIDAAEARLTVEFQPAMLGLDALVAALPIAGIEGASPPDAGPTRRDVNTGAERLDDPDSGVQSVTRPAITDYLTLARITAEIRDYARTFPAPMRTALELWTGGASFDEIARALGEVDPERARALVRAAQARLRERFRGRWPEVLEELQAEPGQAAEQLRIAVVRALAPLSSSVARQALARHARRPLARAERAFTDLALSPTSASSSS